MNRWKVFCLEKGQGLGSHAKAWDSLNSRLFNAHPMLDSRFIDELLRHFGADNIALCVLSPSEQPEAMCLLRRAGPGMWSTFLPSQAQIGPMLLSGSEYIAFLLPKLPGYALRIDMLCVDPAFSNFKHYDPLKVNRMDHALTMNVDLTGTFESYWSSRSRKLVQNIGRYQRKAEANGVPKNFIRITNPSELEAAVDRYAILESRGWKGREGTALGSSENQQRFYSDLLRRFDSSSCQTIVYELWLGEKLAASRLLIAEGGLVVMLKTTFDETLSSYAPGRLLLHFAIQDLFTFCAGKSIEFYTDADTDQLAWATGQRWISHWTFHRNTATALLTSLIGVAVNAIRSPDSSKLESGDLFTVDVYRHPNELPADVRDFFAAAESDDFQFGLAWYENLVDAVFEKHDGIRVFVLLRKGKPVTVLPLLVNKTPLGYKVEGLGNFYTTLYSPAVAHDVRYRDLVVLIKAVTKIFGPLKSIRFSSMDPDSMGYRMLQNALHAAQFADFEFFCFGNWYFPQSADWKTYLAGLRGTTRSTIKRMTKKFADAGGTLEIVTDGTGLIEAIAAYEQVYASSWKVAEPFPKFIPGLVNLSKDKGWLRLGVARLEGKPVAAQLWIVINGKANIYKLAYDENFKAYAPGTVLTACLMEHVIDKDRVTEVDFLAGDDPYKRFWMSERRERWGIIAYNPKTAGGILGSVGEVTRRMVKPAAIRFKAFMQKVHERKMRQVSEQSTL